MYSTLNDAGHASYQGTTVWAKVHAQSMFSSTVNTAYGPTVTEVTTVTVLELTQVRSYGNMVGDDHPAPSVSTYSTTHLDSS